jgi:hypothetical protein
MIGKVLVGAAVVGAGVVALARSERGQALLIQADEKLQGLQDFIDAKIEAEGGEPNAEKIEQAVRDAAIRAAEALGLNVDALKVDVRAERTDAPQPDPAPEPERDTPMGPSEV